MAAAQPQTDQQVLGALLLLLHPPQLNNLRLGALLYPRAAQAVGSAQVGHHL